MSSSDRFDLLDHLHRCHSCAVLLTATRGRRDAGAVTAWRLQVAEHLEAVYAPRGPQDPTGGREGA